MKKPGLALVIGLLAFASLARAQARFEQIVEIKVRPGGQDLYESFLRRAAEAAEKTGANLHWMVFEVVVGKPAPTYRIVLPFDKWAERDSWDDFRQCMNEAFGPQESGRLWRDSQAVVEQMTTNRIWRDLPDSGSHPREEIARFYEVHIREVKPELLGEVRRLHRQFKDAYDRDPGKPSVTRSVLDFGDNPNLVFRRSLAFDSWAERDGYNARGMFDQRFGRDSAQAMIDSIYRSVLRTEHFVSAFRPQLSRPPAATTSNDD